MRCVKTREEQPCVVRGIYLHNMVSRTGHVDNQDREHEEDGGWLIYMFQWIEISPGDGLDDRVPRFLICYLLLLSVPPSIF
jgi:hypothetical protein